MLCAKSDLNWPSGSGEEDFCLNVSVFLVFRYYLPLERGYPLHLNRFKSPSTKDDLCQVWLKFAQWFWRRCLNYPIPFLNFYDYLPFKEDLAFI